MPINLIIADDHAIVREGIRALLEKMGRDIVIRGEASDGKEALELAKKKPADVYVLDAAMPRLNGLEAASRLLREDKKAKVILLTMHNDPGLVRRAMEAGVRGYVLKENTSEDLVKAIRAVSRGGTYFSVSATQEPGGKSGREAGDASRLTPKEREIVQLIAEGLADKEISRKLKISANTVHAHRNNIARKLDIHKQTDLVRFAIREKIAIL
ncbi:MAG: response regulator transcription factor [Elusimicrobia bacterium]|nr:response regulator transcription factor [Elusimicrobiota bacterium]